MSMTEKGTKILGKPNPIAGSMVAMEIPYTSL